MRKNKKSDAAQQFHGLGFWLLRRIGLLTVFTIGLKMGKLRRLTIPGVVFTFLRMLAFRR